MMDHSELRQAAADLIRIEQAGRLDELWGDVAAWHRETPHGYDLNHCTAGQNIYSHETAKAVSRLFEVPAEACLTAATEVILDTRRKAMLGIVASFIRELDGTTETETTTDGTPAAIARARARKAK